MKPKIVKFKNGKYGVRRRHFNTLWIEIEFLSRWGWWHCFVTPSIDPDYTFDSIQEAQSVINKSKLEEEKFNQWYYDKGEVVKLQQVINMNKRKLYANLGGVAVTALIAIVFIMSIVPLHWFPYFFGGVLIVFTLMVSYLAGYHTVLEHLDGIRKHLP